MTLDFPESKATAARYVREAIPMMVKNDIAPNPCNFALWYAYVSNRDFELKIALDDAISNKGTCPPPVSKELFKKHVIGDEIDLQQSLQDSFSNIIDDLSDDVKATREGTDELTSDLEHSLNMLSSSTDQEAIELAVKDLISSTSAKSKIFDRFQEQLVAAELEISALKAQLTQKEQESYIDPLTKIGNRRAFDERLFQLCDGDNPATLILVDLDHFKKLNDNYGHLLGDKVLQGVAQILKKVCPDHGLAARYGGEEFAFLLEADGNSGYALAERVRELLKKLSLRKKNSEQVIDSITASFGVAEKLAGEHPEQLIERADKALYAAKDSGRDRVEKAA